METRGYGAVSENQTAGWWSSSRRVRPGSPGPRESSYAVKQGCSRGRSTRCGAHGGWEKGSRNLCSRIGQKGEQGELLSRHPLQGKKWTEKPEGDVSRLMDEHASKVMLFRTKGAEILRSRKWQYDDQEHLDHEGSPECGRGEARGGQSRQDAVFSVAYTRTVPKTLP